jgi:hypothetical protein
MNICIEDLLILTRLENKNITDSPLISIDAILLETYQSYKALYEEK